MLGCTPDAFDSKIRLLADLPSIAVTEELLCDCYGRWENCKNFKNSPGGLTREEALSLFAADCLKSPLGGHPINSNHGLEME